MKMKSPIILCFLLAYAACAQSGHFQDEGLSEMEEMEEIEEMALQTEGKRACFICERIMEKVKSKISPDDSRVTAVAIHGDIPWWNGRIERVLHSICNLMPTMKEPCKKIVSKYLNKLADELSADDAPRRACIKMRLCKPKA